MFVQKNINTLLPKNLNNKAYADTIIVYWTTKRRSKFLVLGTGTRRTFWLSSCTPLGYFLMSCPGQDTSVALLK